MAQILLVEDYPSLQEIYKTVLEAERHTVQLAGNGDEALEMAGKEHFDVILLDLLTPQTGGMDFLRAYDTRKHPKSRVIIISNIYSTELLNEALQLGASHYLIKADITPKQLTEVVQSTLDEIKKTLAEKQD